MKSHQVVWALALFVFLIGFVGFFRTGSAIPILINGVIAGITALLATLLSQKLNGARIVTSLWLAASFCLYGYMTFFPVGAHANPRAGQSILFGSMAFFALLALTVVVLSKKRR